MSLSSSRAVVDLSLVNMGRKTALDKLLADIPAFSVGLLGFATLTFFMILRKVKLAPFIVLFSVLFTFFAAIVDLARISLRHDNRGRVRTDTEKITRSLITVREVLSSIAAGLRFLYFWAFVAQPPLCEQGSGSFLRLHSGSWLHWGLTGTVLRSTTLLASISILVLQVLWRVVKSLSEFGPVYNVESALEITASAIYIVKLLLNSTIVEPACRRETLWQYSTAFFALLINLGVGVGNLISFRFSETALGRLLLVTELYILIVSSMVFSFYTRNNATPPLPQTRDKRASSFRGLHVSFYDTGLGLVGDGVMNPTEPRQSTSSWLSWNAPLRRSSQLGSSYNDGRRPTSEEEAERGANSFFSKERLPSIRDDVPPPSDDSSATDPITRGISEGFSSSPIVRLSASSVYDNDQSSTPTAAAMVTSPDSPTLPYGGIREARESNRPSLRRKQPSDGSTSSSQLSGFEDLLRQQNELERSIAALRAMYVPEQSGEQPRGGSPGTVSDLPERSRLRESSTTGYGPTSASNKSDFSLSVFPVPPQVPQTTETPARTGRRSSMASAPTPAQMSYTEEQVLPVSTAEDEVAISAFARRTESAGTHYDVTSFIGDLTAPNSGSAAQLAMYLRDSFTDSELDSVDRATIVTVERRPSNGVISRPQLVEKASLVPEVPVTVSSSTPARPSESSARGTPSRQQSPSPPPPAFTRAPSPRALVTQTGRVVGLPPRPKRGDSPTEDQQMGNVLNTAAYKKR